MTSPAHTAIPAPPGELRILTIRGQSVVLDRGLAAIYGVTTGNFNKAVKRNLDRFPDDFSFVLSRAEFRALIFQTGTSKARGGRRKLPRVFTEHGAIMAAAILNRPRAGCRTVFGMKIRQDSEKSLVPERGWI